MGKKGNLNFRTGINYCQIISHLSKCIVLLMIFNSVVGFFIQTSWDFEIDLLYWCTLSIVLNILVFSLFQQTKKEFKFLLNKYHHDVMKLNHPVEQRVVWHGTFEMEYLKSRFNLMLLTFFLLSSFESGYTYYYDYFKAVKYNWGHYYDLIIYYVIIETFNIGISLTTAATNNFNFFV